jgi:hypothetical protein
MVGDYQGALLNISYILEENGLNIIDLRSQAVLKTICGDLQGAMEDWDTALQLVSESPKRQINVPGFGNVGPCCFVKTHLLLGRGYTKMLMGDCAGGREDHNEAAVMSQLLLNAKVLLNSQIDCQLVEKWTFYSPEGFVDLLSADQFKQSDASLQKKYFPAPMLVKLPLEDVPVVRCLTWEL